LVDRGGGRDGAAAAGGRRDRDVAATGLASAAHRLAPLEQEARRVRDGVEPPPQRAQLGLLPLGEYGRRFDRVARVLHRIRRQAAASIPDAERRALGARAHDVRARCLPLVAPPEQRARHLVEPRIGRERARDAARGGSKALDARAATRAARLPARLGGGGEVPARVGEPVDLENKRRSAGVPLRS